jgi:hypothetical protein
VLVLAAVALSLATGCASSTRIYVKSTQQTNDGKTLYMMVRRLEGPTVGTERYQEAAARLFADPPDATVVNSQPVIPGNTVSVVVDEQEAKGIVLYFFFTDPGPNWRVPLMRPLPAEVYVDLGRNQIERVQIRKR